VVALDLADRRQVFRLVETLLPYLRLFKVGSQLYVRFGPAIVEDLRRLGAEVFLDLKFHDIPRTVERAVDAACQLGVRWISLHACGGSGMMRAARKAVEGSGTELLAVTVLTSLSQEDWEGLGWRGRIEEAVAAWARLAMDNGMAGIICSPREVAIVREAVGSKAWIVTPGVRDGQASTEDQKRVLGAREAFRRGATHIVVGRPILEASDPVAVVEGLLRQSVP
jgi:orotidine-5'-phosphate decarboxylase